jgi:hypothetical protein
VIAGNGFCRLVSAMVSFVSVQRSTVQKFNVRIISFMTVQCCYQAALASSFRR